MLHVVWQAATEVCTTNLQQGHCPWGKAAEVLADTACNTHVSIYTHVHHCNYCLLQIRMQDAVQAAAAAEERRIRADNYRATLVVNMQLAEKRAARDAADRQNELLRSEAEFSATLADPYLGEDPAMAASSLSANRYACR